jgi:hypothetical protein
VDSGNAPRARSAADEDAKIVSYGLAVDGNHGRVADVRQNCSVPTYPEPADLYPEVAAAGSLAGALRAVAIEQGLSVPVPIAESSSLYSAAVPTTVPHRWELLVSASYVERLWSIDGRERAQDFTVIRGETSDLAQVAWAAQAWHDGATLTGIVEAASFVQLTGRSCPAAIRLRWPKRSGSNCVWTQRNGKCNGSGPSTAR